MFSAPKPKNHSLEELQILLDYTFKDISLLKKALTRESALQEGLVSRKEGSYQRLEFLGDRVLELVISDLLYEYYPEIQEGQLTIKLSYYVSNQNLPVIAESWQLGDLLITGNGEKQNNIQKNPKALADAVEAVLGAIWLDSKRNYNVLKEIIVTHWQLLGLTKPANLIEEIELPGRNSYVQAYLLQAVLDDMNNPHVLFHNRGPISTSSQSVDAKPQDKTFTHG